MIELLVTIGIVGTLSTVVIVAVNPGDMLGKSDDAKRSASATQMEKAMQQYLIENGSYPGEADIPDTEGDAKPVCAEGTTDTTCVDLSPLVPTYIAALPRDTNEKCEIFSGYKAYTSNGRIQIIPSHLGLTPDEISVDITCPGVSLPTIIASVADGATASFGTATQGLPAAPMIISIQNTGNVALVLNEISVTRTSGAFSTSFDGGAFEGQASVSVPGNSTRNLVLAMSTVALGNVSGTVSFKTNDPSRAVDEPYTFSVSGTVTDAPVPTIAVASGSTSLTSGASTVTLPSTVEGTPGNAYMFTVSNNGTAPLTISSVISSNPAFTVSHSLTTIAQGGSGAFTVRLAGTSVGSPSGAIVIDTAELPNFSFTVNGTVSNAPAPIMAVASGSTVLTSGVSTVTLPATTQGSAGNAYTFKISNTGNAALTITSILSSDPAFTVTHGLATIAQGGSGTFTVRLAGTSAGSPSGTIIIDTAELPNFTFTVTGTVNAGGTGPVAWWMLDETTATNAIDASGNSQTATAIGTGVPQPSTDVPAALVGQSTHSRLFDGSNDYFSANLTTLGTTNTVTLSMWYKPTAINAYDGLLETRVSSLGALLLSGASGNPITASWSNSPLEYSAATGLAVQMNAWNFVAAVYEPTKTTVYLKRSDSASMQSYVLTQTNAAVLRNGIWNMGRDPNTSAQTYITGYLDDVRIYNRSLSAGEVAALVPAVPSMAVASGSTALTSGVSTVTLPSTTQGTAGNPYTFRISNTGTVPLTITGISTSTAELTVSSALTTIPASSSGTFTVRLTGTTSGAKSGTITIDTAELADFTFTANGTVSAGATGLVGWWKLDEAVPGSSVADSSGNGFNGTTVGSSGTQSGPQPNTDMAQISSNVRSLRFDGTDDYVSIPHDANLNPGAGSFSVALWMKLSSTSAGRMVNKYGASGNPGFLFDANATTNGVNAAGYLRLRLTDASSNNADLVQDASLATNQWYHLVAVVDRSNNQARFYRNGTQVGSSQSIASIGSISNTSLFGIGVMPFSPLSSPFSGRMDDVRYYNRALSASEISTLATTVSTPTITVQSGSQVIVAGQSTMTVPNAYQGTAGNTVSYIITNGGNAPLTISSITASNADFTVSHSLTTIAAGSNGTFTVGLSNTATTGAKTATITINTAQLSPFTYTVNGTVNSSLLQGLLAHWRFEETVAGTVAADASGNSRTATPSGAAGTQNMPQPVTDIASALSAISTRSVQMDGTDDTFTATGLPVNTGAGGATTVAFWMKWNGQGDRVPISINGTSDSLFFRNGCIGFYVGELNNVLGTSSTGLSGSWHHVVATFANGVPSASTSEIWIDGVKRTLVGCTGLPTTSRTVSSTLRIGGEPGLMYGGYFDEVRVYNRLLTSGEISTLYAGGQ